MPVMFLVEDVREPDYFLNETEIHRGVPVDLSDEFVGRYEEAGRLYDSLQAELELIYKSKEV